MFPRDVGGGMQSCDMYNEMLCPYDGSVTYTYGWTCGVVPTGTCQPC
jgi:hypothetical protein